MKRDKHIGITINSEHHGKLVYIAEYEGRSMSGQILHLIQKCIREFEKEHGSISIDKEWQRTARQIFGGLSCWEKERKP